MAVKIEYKKETLQVLQLLNRGKQRVSWLQDKGNLDLDRKTLHCCLDQLSHLGLITREYQTEGDIDYICNKITPKGTKLLQENIPLNKSHKIRM